MGQRNMICPSQMMDLEMYQQGEAYLCPPPSIHFGGSTNIQHPNIHTMVTASGSSTNFDAQHLPERYDNAPFYGMTQYNGQHHHNLDLGVATPANFYYSYMTPSSSSGVLPVPMNHGASDSVPSSSNYGVVGISAADEYGRNSRIMDDLRGPCKRKNPECLPGNFQYFNASASPSSSVPPLNMRHPEGVAVMDAVNFSLPQYVGTGNPPIMEAGPQISMRNRSATTGLESVPTHDHNHLSQGNYVGQRFQPAGTLWLDQHLNSNSGDGGPSAWNQVPIPFMHGRCWFFMFFPHNWIFVYITVVKLSAVSPTSLKPDFNFSVRIESFPWGITKYGAQMKFMHKKFTFSYTLGNGTLGLRKDHVATPLGNKLIICGCFIRLKEGHCIYLLGPKCHFCEDLKTNTFSCLDLVWVCMK